MLLTPKDPKYGEVVEMFIDEGQTIEDIAQELNVTPRTVQKYLVSGGVPMGYQSVDSSDLKALRHIHATYGTVWDFFDSEVAKSREGSLEDALREQLLNTPQDELIKMVIAVIKIQQKQNIVSVVQEIVKEINPE